jgi:hypothetical protein
MPPMMLQLFLQSKNFLETIQTTLPTLGQDELIARALESEKAIQEGRVFSIEELEEEMKNW